MRKALDEHFSNSILRVGSEKWHETIISKTTLSELQNLPSGWLFDWKKEVMQFPTYKLATVENPTSIEGLICLEEKRGFFYVALIENSPTNRGLNRVFKGIPSNLFAFACKLSDECGFGGFVAFDAKTALKLHYQTTIGAKVVGNSNRMFIDELLAQELIKFHFPK